MKRLTALGALVLACGYLAAFAPLPAAADVSACKLLTKSDIEMVLHVNVGDGSALSGDAAKMLPSGASSCVYRRPGARDIDMIATITVTRAGPAMFDSIVQNYKSPALAVMGTPTP